MVLLVEPEVLERVPLVETPEGAVLVQGTRVPLDIVVNEFNWGQSPEDIVRGYDVLKLADVYAILTYYLRHREAVDEYVAQRRKAADELRARSEADPNYQAFVEKFRRLKAQQHSAS